MCTLKESHVTVAITLAQTQFVVFNTTFYLAISLLKGGPTSRDKYISLDAHAASTHSRSRRGGGSDEGRGTRPVEGLSVIERGCGLIARLVRLPDRLPGQGPALAATGLPPDGHAALLPLLCPHNTYGLVHRQRADYMQPSNLPLPSKECLTASAEEFCRKVVNKHIKQF